MRSILEELWYENVCPHTGGRGTTKEEKALMRHIADHRDSLEKTLTKEQKETLEKLDDCYAELTDMNERELFVYAFRLGARIAMEIMSFRV